MIFTEEENSIDISSIFRVKSSRIPEEDGFKVKDLWGYPEDLVAIMAPKNGPNPSYDYRLMPNEPVKVSVNAYIRSMGPFDIENHVIITGDRHSVP